MPVVLSAGDEIRNLLGRYCSLIDAGDFAGVGALMADAVLATEDGSPLARGAAEVEAMYAGMVRLLPDGTPGTQHVVANTVLEPQPDGTVRATSAYVVLQATPDLPLQPVITGRYVDTFAPPGDDGGDGGAWRFTERRFGVGRAGDLRQHLSIDPTDPTDPTDPGARP